LRRRGARVVVVVIGGQVVGAELAQKGLVVAGCMVVCGCVGLW
jgi:hypothetical protein